MSPALQIGSWQVTAPAPAPDGPAPVSPAPARLSVVVPYYRGAATIGDAIRSVLEQTTEPHEIVICDDGSPDDLPAALGELAGRVRVLRKENGGIASAMNALTEAASGDYLVQLDQDDAFAPRRLEAISELLAARPDLDLVASDAVVEMEGREVVRLEQISRYEGHEERRTMLRTCAFLWPAIRRAKLIEVGGYDESFPVMQDWECFARLVLSGARVGYVHAPLYRWRMTPGSRSSQDRVANVLAIERMLRKLQASCPLDAAERAEADRLLADRRRWLVREQARQAVQEGRAGEARRRSLALLAGHGFDRATRLKAAVTVLSPALAARFLERRHELADPAREALAERGFHWAS